MVLARRETEIVIGGRGVPHKVTGCSSYLLGVKIRNLVRLRQFVFSQELACFESEVENGFFTFPH